MIAWQGVPAKVWTAIHIEEPVCFPPKADKHAAWIGAVLMGILIVAGWWR